MSTVRNERKPVTHLTFFENLVAGGLAGTLECLIMYPLDVVKTLQQLKIGQSAEGTFSFTANLIKREKLLIYRGISAPLLMETPKRAIKFTANNTFKPMFGDKNGKLTQCGSIAAGACAGITEAFIIVPFELIKIRMQSRDNVARYANSADAVVKVFQQEGLSTFYKGLESTIWRNLFWNGAYFGVIHYFATHHNDNEEWKSGWRLMLRNFAVGCIGGFVGTTLNTPFDVVKSRFQNSPNPSPWTWPAVVSVARKEGISGLWKGYLPKVLRLGPGGGILLVVQQSVASWLVAQRN